jgi:hypothetical protein
LRFVHHAHHGVDGHRFAFAYLDFAQDAGAGRWNLGIDLVGRDLEQRLVALDRVADLFQPSDDRAFGNRLAICGITTCLAIV